MVGAPPLCATTASIIASHSVLDDWGHSPWAQDARLPGLGLMVLQPDTMTSKWAFPKLRHGQRAPLTARRGLGEYQ